MLINSIFLPGAHSYDLFLDLLLWLLLLNLLDLFWNINSVRLHVALALDNSHRSVLRAYRADLASTNSHPDYFRVLCHAVVPCPLILPTCSRPVHQFTREIVISWKGSLVNALDRNASVYLSYLCCATVETFLHDDPTWGRLFYIRGFERYLCVF